MNDLKDHQSTEPILHSEEGFNGCPFCGVVPMVFEIPAHTHGHVFKELEAFGEFPGAFYAECVPCEFYQSDRTLEGLREKWNQRARIVPAMHRYEYGVDMEPETGKYYHCFNSAGGWSGVIEPVRSMSGLNLFFAAGYNVAWGSGFTLVGPIPVPELADYPATDKKSLTVAEEEEE